MTSWAAVGALLILLAASGEPRPNAAPSAVPNCFPAEAHVDEFRTHWFCAHLLAAGEGKLQGEETYRFTYLPTFHHPRVVRVTHGSSGWTLRAVVLSGQGGYKPGNVARSAERKLTQAKARLLLQRLEDAGVWEPDPVQKEVGLDGSMWLLEAKRGVRYQFHEVWSPEANTAPQYRKACEYMLELAGVLPEPKEGELY